MLGAPAQGADDVAAIRRLLADLFDKPEAPLTVEPVVIEQDAAIADWSQGELGGRAFLKRKDGAWEVALCGGDALRQSASLEKLGLARPRAEALAASLAKAERGLSPALLERMAKFDGVVAVDAAGGHSPVDPHHKPIP
ncbi:copper uptake system-associated protein [Methylosinus sp. Sm6]|nr:copper uptake system-associated protein [Methylosinus sp. Sm6]